MQEKTPQGKKLSGLPFSQLLPFPFSILLLAGYFSLLVIFIRIVDAAVIGGDDVLVNLAIRLMQEEGGLRRRDLYTEGLHAAVRERNLDLAWKFLNLGADPDYAGPKSIYCLPPMIKAVCLHDKPMIRLLASFGARAGLHTSYIHDTLREAR